MINHDKTERNSDFWANMAHELWVNVEQLYDQIVTQWADRGEGEGMGGQMAAFCIYSCGFLSSYFCKYPQRKLRVLLVFGHVHADGFFQSARTEPCRTKQRQLWPACS